ncbi:uncharacterized protein [Physcomitrium patens]|uniref:uncharacterized protein n=1 Tax=Physcomitrium patens TaxID=3218 RepID=UPI000D1699E1|nr:uncharacterized protein LOC112278638 [Physcomitrium patens]|eukprot:XP_024368013.1 uncharacterized protein LOC112278638 [Physcomitrella patens]
MHRGQPHTSTTKGSTRGWQGLGTPTAPRRIQDFGETLVERSGLAPIAVQQQVHHHHYAALLHPRSGPKSVDAHSVDAIENPTPLAAVGNGTGTVRQDALLSGFSPTHSTRREVSAWDSSSRSSLPAVLPLWMGVLRCWVLP